MKITIDKTESNSKLLKLMADKNPAKAMEARQAFAEFITQPILQVIQSEPVIGNLFTTWTYDYGTPSSIPLAPLFDIRQQDFIKVWSQARPGGLATSSNSDVTELMVMTYMLESAVSFPLNYLRAARVDVVAAYLQRMAQEFLYKQEINSWSVLASVAAQSTYPKLGTQTAQVIRATTQGALIAHDINNLITLMSRVNSSWVGGTPAGATRSITDLVGSPEFIQQIRDMAFEPMNSRQAVAGGNFPLAGPDKFRDDIYDSIGNPTFYGINLLNVYDMGQGYPYNIVYSTYAGTTTYPNFGTGLTNSPASSVFSPGSEQVVLGIDKRNDFLARLVENNPDDNSTLSVATDNQWSVRSQEVGFYASVREGRVALDGRNVVSIFF